MSKLDELTDTKDWQYSCTAYGEGQGCCCADDHPNKVRLKKFILDLYKECDFNGFEFIDRVSKL